MPPKCLLAREWKCVMNTVLIYLHIYFWPLSPASGSRFGVVAGQVKPSQYSTWALSAHSISPLNLRRQKRTIWRILPCSSFPAPMLHWLCRLVSIYVYLMGWFLIRGLITKSFICLVLEENRLWPSFQSFIPRLDLFDGSFVHLFFHSFGDF